MQVMQLANRVSGLRSGLPARRSGAHSPATRQAVVVRFQDDRRPGTEADTKTKLSPEQLKEIETTEVGSNLSPRMAEMRADLGTEWKKFEGSAGDGWTQVQAFDGPGPETVNGRAAMLGVVTGLGWEWFTGLDLNQQTADHPYTVLASFIIIAFATYAPIYRGYTRKEPWANSFWSPKAENWNGRLAMMGYLGMVLTEALSHMNTLQWWGLQPHA